MREIGGNTERLVFSSPSVRFGLGFALSIRETDSARDLGAGFWGAGVSAAADFATLGGAFGACAAVRTGFGGSAGAAAILPLALVCLRLGAAGL